MKQILFTLLTLCLLTQQGLAAAEKPKQPDYITLHIPQAIITDALRKALPLTLDDNSSQIDGTITILAISNLQLQQGKILCRLDLQGTNLQLVTKVANQSIRLNLGSARVDFDCAATLRYDRKRKMLLLRPIASNIANGAENTQPDIGQALTLLLNGREFPLAIQELTPFVAQTGGKLLTISTEITGVWVVDGAIQLGLTPRIAVSPR